MSKKIFRTILITSLLFHNSVLLAGQRPVVSGVTSGDRRMAVINGELVEEGGEIDGFKLEKVEEDSVRLRYYDTVIDEPVVAGKKRFSIRTLISNAIKEIRLWNASRRYEHLEKEKQIEKERQKIDRRTILPEV